MASGVEVARYHSFVGSDRRTYEPYHDEQDIVPLLEELGVEITGIKEGDFTPIQQIGRFFHHPKEVIDDLKHWSETKQLARNLTKG